MTCNPEKWCVAHADLTCAADAASEGSELPDGPAVSPDLALEQSTEADGRTDLPADSAPESASADASADGAADAAADGPVDAAAPPDMAREAPPLDLAPDVPPLLVAAVPGAVLRQGSREPDVFYLGKDGVIVERDFICGVGDKGSLGLIDDFLLAVGTPSVTSWAKGRMDLFVRGMDDRIHMRTYDNNCWVAGWIYVPGPAVSSDPAAVSPEVNRIDVFARGGSNNALLHIGFNMPSFDNDWESLGGSVLSTPAAVSIAGDLIDVFALDSSRRVQRLRSSGDHWLSWEPLGGDFVDGPAVATRPGESALVYAADVAHQLAQMRVDRAGHGAWENTGVTLPPGPFRAVSLSANEVMLLALTPAGELWTRVLTYP
jgi:hypothetical protein